MKQPEKAKPTLFLTPPSENPATKSKMLFFQCKLEHFKSLPRARIARQHILAGSNLGLSRVTVSRQWETHAFSDFCGKKGFWGHNFGSRYARRSSKSSIDAGDHLLSKKSLSQNFGPLDQRPGPVKVGQKPKTPPLCEPLPGEPHTQIKKFF